VADSIVIVVVGGLVIGAALTRVGVPRRREQRSARGFCQDEAVWLESLSPDLEQRKLAGILEKLGS
jgi:hypothetical protein